MASPNDVIEKLTAALRTLLEARDRDGNRLIYGEHRESVRNTVVMEQCRVCDEVDGHRQGCVIGDAERTLREIQGANS